MIKEGLKPGDRVVLEGTDRLKEGSEVEVVNDSIEVPAAPADNLHSQASDAAPAPEADGKAHKGGA